GALQVAAVCLLFLLEGVFLKQICSKQDVLDYLNLTRNNEKFKTCRPAMDWTKPTIVYFDVYLYGILSMIEKSQIFIPLIWMSVRWKNEWISWDPKKFCGITDVILPKEMLWMPDLYVVEAMDDDLKIVSTCAMDVHKFPFDTQTCHITVSSVNHSDKEIKLVAASNSTKATQRARESILTQGEWEFLNISISSQNETYEGQTFDGLMYTIAVRRMPLMHLINFQLPILFFLILDLASFFMPDGAEKLSFKGVFLKQICSKQDVLDYLNLTRNNEKFKTCRPAMDWTKPTIVYFDVYLYGILSMTEKSQTFTPLIWMSVRWKNEWISWDPKKFCGITDVILPKERLWMPDLFVLEAMDDDHKIVSTCAMDVHKFPFDTQTCRITVSSVNHSDKEIKLITVRRMPLMHLINFQLPILFFLILDLASFFMPDGAEKLSFKVTLLLAISMLLLILNDTLPSTSHRCPLIGGYLV
ncbi:hypothetical protein DNTS_010211, partial [Danionella cerebrum]